MQLVFIHGSGGTGEVWQYQLEAFPGAVAPTLPGHPDGEIISTMEGYTRWVHSFIAENGYRDVVLVATPWAAASPSSTPWTTPVS